MTLRQPTDLKPPVRVNPYRLPPAGAHPSVVADLIHDHREEMARIWDLHLAELSRPPALQASS